MSLTATDLKKSYGRRKLLNGVNIRINKSEIVGLLGPNGAGKTTCFYIIVGLIKADHGTIIMDEEDVTHMAMYQRARLGVGYLAQEPSVFKGLTVAENIMSALEIVEPNKILRQEKLDKLLEEFNIEFLRNTKAQVLSGGERRRTEIARCLALNPKYVLLDEPLAGIDPIAVNDIKSLIIHLKKREMGILITDHNVLDALNIIDRGYILYDGKILVEGSPQDIINSEIAQKHYLGGKGL